MLGLRAPATVKEEDQSDGKNVPLILTINSIACVACLVIMWLDTFADELEFTPYARIFLAEIYQMEPVRLAWWAQS